MIEEVGEDLNDLDLREIEDKVTNKVHGEEEAMHIDDSQMIPEDELDFDAFDDMKLSDDIQGRLKLCLHTVICAMFCQIFD